MEHTLKNIKLKYQLLLLLALPTITILYLSTEKLLQNHDLLQKVHHAQAMEQILTTATELIAELQIERGLSVAFVASGGTHFTEELQLQRNIYDSKNKELSQQIIDNFAIYKVDDHAVTWSKLQTRLNQTQQAREEVDRLKSRPQLIFERYTSLIDAILLNIKHRYSESDHADQHSAEQQEHVLSLLQLQEYSAQERGLVNIILTSDTISSSLFQQVTTVNWMQNRLISQHDTVSDKNGREQPLLSQLNHPAFAALEATRKAIIQKPLKDELLNKINLLANCSDFLYNVKNHLISNDNHHHTNFLQQYAEATELLKRYRALDQLTTAELDALKTIEERFNIYKSKLQIIKEKTVTFNQDQTDLPDELDRQLRVDIQPALSALRTLEQAFKVIPPEKWFELATQRIEIINQHQKRLHQLIITQLHQQVVSAQLSTTITTLFLIGTLLITAFISFIIFKRLSVGISTIALQMQRAQTNGRLIDEALIGKDELGLMASTLNQLITERKAINKELEQHRHHLERLFEQKSHAFDRQQLILQGVIQTSLDAIITIDSDGVITDFNPAAEKTFLYQESEAVGKNISNLIIPIELREAHKKGLASAASLPSGQFVGQRYEVPAMRADGTSLTVEIAMGRIKVNNAILFTAFLRDITDRLQHQEKLEQAKRRAEVANMAKSEFLANMSHELRTPMHAILSFSEMGLSRYKTITPDKLYKYFNTINISGNRLLKLLNELLDLAKIEANMVDYNFNINDISLIINEVINEYEELINQHKLDITFTPTKFSTCLSIDSEKIERVIKNLLSNAIKFSPEEGTISISLTQQQIMTSNGEPLAALLLSVKDQGVGVPEDELKAIFDKFIQSSKSQTGAGGTGLGLAICKEIIKAHNGKVWAENNDNDAGCLFSVLLPIKQPSHHLDQM